MRIQEEFTRRYHVPSPFPSPPYLSMLYPILTLPATIKVDMVVTRGIDNKVIAYAGPQKGSTAAQSLSAACEMSQCWRIYLTLDSVMEPSSSEVQAVLKAAAKMDTPLVSVTILEVAKLPEFFLKTGVKYEEVEIGGSASDEDEDLVEVEDKEVLDTSHGDWLQCRCDWCWMEKVGGGVDRSAGFVSVMGTRKRKRSR